MDTEGFIRPVDRVQGEVELPAAGGRHGLHVPVQRQLMPQGQRRLFRRGRLRGELGRAVHHLRLGVVNESLVDLLRPLLLRHVDVRHADPGTRTPDGGRAEQEPPFLRRRRAGVFEPRPALAAGQDGANRSLGERGLVREGSARRPAHGEVVATASFRERDATAVVPGELPPCLVHGHDDPGRTQDRRLIGDRIQHVEGKREHSHLP